MLSEINAGLVSQEDQPTMIVWLGKTNVIFGDHFHESNVLVVKATIQCHGEESLVVTKETAAVCPVGCQAFCSFLETKT